MQSRFRKTALAAALALSCLAFGARAQAGEVYRLDADLPVHPLEAYAEVLTDVPGTLEPADVLRAGAEDWTPLDSVALPYGPRYRGRHLPLGAEAHWVRLRLASDAPLAGWQVHLEDRLHHNIAWIRGNGRADIYALTGDSLLWHRITGADLPRGARDLAGPRALDRVRAEGLPAGDTVTLLARLEPNGFGFPAAFNASLRAPGYHDYHPLYSSRVLFNAFVFGVMAIMLVLHLALFAYLRDRMHGYLALWLAFATVTHAMTVGFEPADWLPFWHPNLRVALWLLVPSNMLFAFWLFGRAYVGTAAKYPRLDRAMWLIPATMFAVVLVQVVRVVAFDVPRPFTALPGLYAAIGLLALAGIAVAGLLAAKRDDLLARYFGVGALVASGFLVLGGLWAVRVVRVPFDPFAAGVLAQALVYSFGLAYRQQLRTRRARADELAAERARGEVARMRDLDEVKARFFANVSHEFRTPLTLITGPLDAAHRRAERERGEGLRTVPLDVAEFAGIRRNADRLRGLVDQLLELSRLQGGELYLRLRRGGLVGFVRARVLAFESLAESRGITLHASFPPERAGGFYDADKLETLVNNLLGNAVKYTPERGSVTVTCAHEGDYVVLEVSDTGPGIPAEALDRIFERFYRAGGTEAEGSGIGLALTKELVDLYGGTVAVRSELGRGTTFRLRLPVTLAALPEGVVAEDPSDDAAAVPSVLAEAQAANGTPAGGARDELDQAAMGREHGVLAQAVTEGAGLATRREPALSEVERAKTNGAPGAPSDSGKARATVLVVEDSDELRDFVAGILAPRYRVLAARDGEQGLRLATEHVPDLVVSDVMMPGRDGYAVCHALKANPKTSHVPVILLTAKADRASTLAGLTQGADDYLTKPFDPDELLLRVRNLLEARERLWAHFRGLDLTLVPEVDAQSAEERFVGEVAAAIRERLGDETLGVEDLARRVGFSRSQLTRKLRALTGKTPSRLIAEMRLHEARRLLRRGAGNVSEVAYRVGYANLSYFAKSFRELHGELPSAVRRGVEEV